MFQWEAYGAGWLRHRGAIEGERVRQITGRGAGKAGARRAGSCVMTPRDFSTASVEVADPWYKEFKAASQRNEVTVLIR